MISVKNLHKHFGSLVVLDGIDIEIKKGEKVAVIGPSGSGKSTFLRCLNLLERPTLGHIYYNDKEITYYHKISKFSKKYKNYKIASYDKKIAKLIDKIAVTKEKDIKDKEKKLAELEKKMSDTIVLRDELIRELEFDIEVRENIKSIEREYLIQDIKKTFFENSDIS